MRRIAFLALAAGIIGAIIAIFFNPLSRLAETYGMGADEWERVVTRTWFYLTPPTLVLATVIMIALITQRRRWSRRMSRASLGLLSSYAIIMSRFLVLDVLDIEVLPQPWALLVWTYAFATVVYFLYALIAEWVIPFIVRRFRKDTIHEDGFDDDPDDLDPEPLANYGRHGSG